MRKSAGRCRDAKGRISTLILANHFVMSVTATERTIGPARFIFMSPLNVRPVPNPGYSRRRRFTSFSYHVGIIFARYSCNTIHS